MLLLLLLLVLVCRAAAVYPWLPLCRHLASFLPWMFLVICLKIYCYPCCLSLFFLLQPSWFIATLAVIHALFDKRVLLLLLLLLSVLGLPDAATLVHCGAGVSRSAALVMMYLMRSRQWSAQKAKEHVIAARSLASPNDGFWRVLCALEGSLGIVER